eukprot:TRINITY_DN37999_c0_g1_i3.p1 TRINITY_DN37999_c0_g1~~TRINITY_DN37999_c0_g1_i3.p1  ORF type:complete len:502 (+),score=128.29 TRINITY_DN37999_c0_g1_i3:185-1690(+)
MKGNCGLRSNMSQKTQPEKPSRIAPTSQWSGLVGWGGGRMISGEVLPQFKNAHVWRRHVQEILTQHREQCQQHIADGHAALQKLQAELEAKHRDTTSKHASELTKATEARESLLRKQKQEHEEELQRRASQHAAERQSHTEEKEKAVEALAKKHQEEIAFLRRQHEEDKKRSADLDTELQESRRLGKVFTAALKKASENRAAAINELAAKHKEEHELAAATHAETIQGLLQEKEALVLQLSRQTSEMKKLSDNHSQQLQTQAAAQREVVTAHAAALDKLKATHTAELHMMAEERRTTNEKHEAQMRAREKALMERHDEEKKTLSQQHESHIAARTREVEQLILKHKTERNESLVKMTEERRQIEEARQKDHSALSAQFERMQLELSEARYKMQGAMGKEEQASQSLRDLHNQRAAAEQRNKQLEKQLESERQSRNTQDGHSAAIQAEVQKLRTDNERLKAMLQEATDDLQKSANELMKTPQRPGVARSGGQFSIPPRPRAR